ncbi:hypothetical protein B0H10DRAFT_1950990 [Mycena sp. CBHHK59/15]|nr:hypothetical protein B0H10DRAFT_1950990 [Mycena sp. CBHHK59/15]
MGYPDKEAPGSPWLNPNPGESVEAGGPIGGAMGSAMGRAMRHGRECSTIMSLAKWGKLSEKDIKKKKKQFPPSQTTMESSPRRAIAADVKDLGDLELGDELLVPNRVERRTAYAYGSLDGSEITHVRVKGAVVAIHRGDGNWIQSLHLGPVVGGKRVHDAQLKKISEFLAWSESRSTTETETIVVDDIRCGGTESSPEVELVLTTYGQMPGDLAVLGDAVDRGGDGEDVKLPPSCGGPACRIARLRRGGDESSRPRGVKIRLAEFRGPGLLSESSSRDWLPLASRDLEQSPLCKADRDFRYQKDQEALAQTQARTIAAEARAARHSSRTISTEPSAATTLNLTSVSFPQKTSVSIPSTPTISTPSDLTPSPETPPTLLPAFFTPRAPRRAPSPNPPFPPKSDISDDDMAPSKTMELFRGNGTTEKAHTWLRTLEQTWKWDADDKEKMYRFEKGLHPGGQAEEWWSKLTAAEKQTWAALMVAFETKWAKPTATRRAQDVVIAELTNNCLDRDALGKYVNDEDGVLVLSHIAWAEVTRGLLGELASGDVGMMLKSSIRATLPVEFRHLIVDTGLDTWEKYLKAVEDVSVDRINDAVEERTSRETKMDNDIFSPSRLAPPVMPRYAPPAARQSQPPSSPATRQAVTPNPRAYQTTPSTTLNTPRMPWANRTSPDVFSGSTVRPYPNTFAKNLATPVSPSANRGRPTTLSGGPARDVDLVRHCGHPELHRRHGDVDFPKWQ